MRLLIAAFIFAACMPLPGQADDAPLAPVKGLEVERYLGKWHEIASIPAWFQDHCVSDTSATYGLTEDGETLTVLNACRDEDGEMDSADGYARFTGPRDEGGLEVTFVSILGFPVWLMSGDYVVIALDEDYRWSAVGHPSRDYAWILAREPALPPETLSQIEAAFAGVGYDTCEILMSPRNAEEARQPLCKQ